MVPSSVTNRNTAGTPGAISKLLVKLKTVPVGAEGPVCPLAGGMVTTRGWGAPVKSYKVDSPIPLSEIHQGDPEARESPQALTRLGSTMTPVETAAEFAVKSVRV